MNPARRNPNRPKVPDLVPLIRAVYDGPMGGAGCCLHVVTDDANWDCARDLVADPSHPNCVAAAAMMAQMTESQVARATRKAHAANNCATCGSYYSVCGHNNRAGGPRP